MFSIVSQRFPGTPCFTPYIKDHAGWSDIHELPYVAVTIYQYMMTLITSLVYVAHVDHVALWRMRDVSVALRAACSTLSSRAGTDGCLLFDELYAHVGSWLARV